MEGELLRPLRTRLVEAGNSGNTRDKPRLLTLVQQAITFIFLLWQDTLFHQVKKLVLCPRNMLH